MKNIIPRTFPGNLVGRVIEKCNLKKTLEIQ